ncbi:MAG TPA: TIGR01244 family sulfur transferase [Allosphingosinicella sp.]
MKRLSDTMFVAGQIAPEEIAGLGVAMIVNNRPDGEEAGQPTSDAIAAAAEAAGVQYRHIPVAGGLSLPLVTQMADALAAADGAVLAFCKSGTRSAFLWALARSRLGADSEELIEQAAAAGYDLSPIRGFLAQG